MGELTIEGATLENGLVGAFGGDFAVFEDDDAVGDFHNFGLMSDDDNSVVFFEVFEKVGDSLRGDGVDGTSDIIEKQDFRFGK